MNPLVIAKGSFIFVSGLGISKIAADIVRNNVPILTPVQRITVNTGTFVLGAMIIENSVEFINRQIDAVIREFEKDKEEEENQGISEASSDGPSAQTT